MKSFCNKNTCTFLLLRPASERGREAQRRQHGHPGAQPQLQRDTDPVVPGRLRPQQDEGAAVRKRRGSEEERGEKARRKRVFRGKPGWRGLWGRKGEGGAGINQVDERSIARIGRGNSTSESRGQSVTSHPVPQLVSAMERVNLTWSERTRAT